MNEVSNWLNELPYQLIRVDVLWDLRVTTAAIIEFAYNRVNLPEA